MLKICLFILALLRLHLDFLSGMYTFQTVNSQLFFNSHLNFITGTLLLKISQVIRQINNHKEGAGLYELLE